MFNSSLDGHLSAKERALGAAFKSQLVDWYLHRVYDELDGLLTDAIAAIPPS